MLQFFTKIICTLCVLAIRIELLDDVIVTQQQNLYIYSLHFHNAMILSILDIYPRDFIFGFLLSS